MSPTRLNQALHSAGPLTPAAVAVDLPTVLVFQATATRIPQPLRVVLTVDSDGLISEVETFPTASPTPPGSWEGVDALLQSVAPQVRLLVADVTDGSCRQIHAIDPATAAPIASVGKLYVLAALATAVQSGRIRWDQQLTLTKQLRSLPSGDLQNQPAGTRISVRDTAGYMISFSDNTATDMLIDLLGRDAVEAALTATGMADPSKDIPFLTTREWFILGLDQWPTLANRYIAADADGRRSLLSTVVDPAPLPDVTAAQALAKPRAIDELGSFASAEDICRVDSWLANAARQPPTTDVDSVFQAEDGGLGLDPAQWRRTWFKGGFGGGVLTSSYLATTRTGHSYVVVALTENPTQALPDTATGSMLAAVRAAFALAARD